MSRDRYLDDDDVDAMLARRRKRNRSRGMLWVGLAAGAAVLIAGAVAIAVLAKNKQVGGGGVAVAPPVLSGVDSWTHQELAEHLRSKGVAIRTQPLFPLGNDSAMRFHSASPGGDQSVDVILCQSRKLAEERAAAMGDDGFAFGRFAFGGGDRGFAASLRAALAR